MQTVTVPTGPHIDPDLDDAWLRPGNWGVVAHQFDVERGYAALMRGAAKKTPRVAPAALHPVLRDGAAVVPALSTATCQRLQAMVAAAPTGFITSEEMGRPMVEELCEELFEGEPGEALRALYGPNFGAVSVRPTPVGPRDDGGKGTAGQLLALALRRWSDRTRPGPRVPQRP